jgi:hypothetical protein
MKKSTNYLVIMLVIVSLGCNTISTVDLSPTPAFTSTPDFTPTPERLHLINDELEACLLISAEEVESISGIQVTSEQGYEAKENTLIVGPTACRYVLKNSDEVIMAISADTDTTLVRQGNNSSASEWFQQMKMVDTDMASKAPTIFKLQDIDNLGEQAYAKMGTLISIHVLKSDIIYWFSTRPIEDGGMGYDALFKLVVIALQRAP